MFIFELSESKMHFKTEILEKISGEDDDVEFKKRSIMFWWHMLKQRRYPNSDELPYLYNIFFYRAFELSFNKMFHTRVKFKIWKLGA